MDQLKRDYYCDKLIATFSIFPSKLSKKSEFEAYNTVFGLSDLIEYADQVFCMENDSLQSINMEIDKGIGRVLELNKIEHSPSFKEMNRIAALYMSNITSTFRYFVDLNSNMRKFSVNMTPFPRLHFYYSSLSPLVPPVIDEATSAFSTSANLIIDLFNTKNITCSVKTVEGNISLIRALPSAFISASMVFRGYFPPEVNPHEIAQEYCDEFLSLNYQCLPNCIKSISFEHSLYGFNTSTGNLKLPLISRIDRK